MTLLLIILGIALIILSVLFQHCKEQFVSGDKHVAIKCHNGLGDRLLDILGASVLCQHLGCGVMELEWDMDHRNFLWGKALYDINLIDLGGLNFTRVNGLSNFVNTNPSDTLAPYKVYSFIKSKGVSVTFDNVVQQYINLASTIRPTEIISPYLSPDLPKCVAIHLRKTDKVVSATDDISISQEGFDALMTKCFEWIRNYIANTPQPYFYVCSEDKDHKDDVITKIRGIGSELNKEVRILTTSEDDIPKDVREKYVGAFEIFEFFCLTQCAAILQATKYSTFSTTAAIISQKPLYNMSEYTRDWLLLAWKPCLRLITTDDNHQYHVVNTTELEHISKKRPGIKM
jgi:hypothetical protein